MALLARGLWPVGLYPRGFNLPNDRGPAEGKEPFSKKWGLVRWTIDKWHDLVKIFSNAGVGICLGPGRGPGGKWLIDLEGDGPEAEASRSQLFGGEVVPTLGWGSARGGHQLFTADGERLGAIVATLKPFEDKGANRSGVYHLESLPGLELRLGGFKPDGAVKQVQSVVPPTLGTDGKPRVFNDVDTIADLPEAAYTGLTISVAAATKPTTRAKPAGSKLPITDRPDIWLRKALENTAGKVAMAATGVRHDTLLAQTRTLAGYLHYGRGFTEAELEAFMIQAADMAAPERKGDNPRCVRNAIANGKAAPLQLPAELHAIATGARAVGPKRSTNGDGKHQEQPEAGSYGMIVISPAEKEVNDEAIAALASGDPNLFSLGYVLATVVHDSDAPRGIEYLDGPPPRLAPVASATLRERMTTVAAWVAIDRNGKEKHAHPPDWSVQAIMQRGQWPGIRRIIGVIEAPTIRRNGSILSAEGYDPQTGLFHAPVGKFGTVPDRPTKTQAQEAAKRLLALVADFPFLDDDHKAAWLAALLSVLARPAIDGPIPLFAFDANCPGVGKSLLADLIAVIATERRMPRTIWPHGRDADEEMRKRITSLALAGERFTLLDNIAWPHTLGGAPLDAALTSTTWKDRILGRSEATGELPMHMVWFATGNNIQLGTDIIRRVIPCRIVTPMESPEDRNDFKIPDLLGHAKANRGDYLADGLTIIRAYFEAGLPKPEKFKALGSYESWSNVIVGAVKWATDLDPCQPRELVKAEDIGAQRRRSLFEGLAKLPGIFSGLTSSEIRKAVEDSPTAYSGLKEALMEFSRDANLPSSRTIGTQLRGMKDRVIGMYRLAAYADGHEKVAKWLLEVVAGCAGSSGVNCGHPAQKTNDDISDYPQSSDTQTPPPAHDPATPRTPRNSANGRETGWI